MGSQQRTVLGCIMALTLVFTWLLGTADAQQPGTTEANAPISVQLTPEKHDWKVGEAIGIEVKVMNRGTKPVLFGRDLWAANNWMYHLSLGVRDLAGRPSTGVAWAVDTLPDSKESFASFLASNWVVLGPNYFYGTEIGIDASLFPVLDRPGRYEICGVFKSLGLTPNLYFNVLAKHPDEVKQLPYEAWEGEVKTNCVEVSIVSSSKLGKDRR